MPVLVRTRITPVEPPALLLTVQGKARVRIRGQVCGFVQCAGERRWVWGAFDETFQIRRQAGPLRVHALGLGGLATETFRFISSVDLTLTGPPALRGKLRWRRPRVPAISPLSAQIIRTVGGAEET